MFYALDAFADGFFLVDLNPGFFSAAAFATFLITFFFEVAASFGAAAGVFFAFSFEAALASLSNFA